MLKVRLCNYQCAAGLNRPVILKQPGDLKAPVQALLSLGS